MKQSGVFLSLSLAFFPLMSVAQEFSIFCYDQQEDEWDWSENKQVFDWPVMTQEQPWENSYFKFVPISESTYKSLDGFCPQGSVPQPAEGNFSIWKVFYVSDGQRSYFAPGKRSYHTLIDHVFLRFSDANLKENVQRVTNTLDALREMNGYRYNYIDKNERTEIGLIAQEVERLYPELIYTHSESGYMQVDYRGMVAILLESIKELDERVSDMENKQP
ncbi:tail fiber domain-containing protein [Vibrio tetraodonis]|uniref:tail fiber domain-containing protein n=1 Tax=Vibrio tetraodonis TaxID=2231647 RepID=UPI000E0A8916|nr:tail fiber domain-containing protein [Vibrio tetraodonis]